MSDNMNSNGFNDGNYSNYSDYSDYNNYKDYTSAVSQDYYNESNVLNPKGKNKQCILGFVFSLISTLFVFLSCIPVFTTFSTGFSTAGVVLSIIGIKKIKNNGQGGRGLGVAGIIIGSVVFVVAVILLIGVIGGITGTIDY